MPSTPANPSPTSPGEQDLQQARSAQRLPDPLPADPLPLLLAWFKEATGQAAGSDPNSPLPPLPNPNAMLLATVDPDGHPSARVVLCKSLDIERGFVVFHTNFQSRKGLALGAHPRAAITMFWDWLDRQVRIEGPAVLSPAAESDAYFATRPLSRRIGAWASDQSRPIASRAALSAKVAETMRRFGLDPANPPPEDAPIAIPRPPHWGGCRVFMERVELWTSGAGRIHDRAAWDRELTPDGPHAFTGGPWRGGWLQP